MEDFDGAFGPFQNAESLASDPMMEPRLEQSSSEILNRESTGSSGEPQDNFINTDEVFSSEVPGFEFGDFQTAEWNSPKRKDNGSESEKDAFNSDRIEHTRLGEKDQIAELNSEEMRGSNAFPEYDFIGKEIPSSQSSAKLENSENLSRKAHIDPSILDDMFSHLDSGYSQLTLDSLDLYGVSSGINGTSKSEEEQLQMDAKQKPDENHQVQSNKILVLGDSKLEDSHSSKNISLNVDSRDVTHPSSIFETDATQSLQDTSYSVDETKISNEKLEPDSDPLSGSSNFEIHVNSKSIVDDFFRSGEVKHSWSDFQDALDYGVSVNPIHSSINQATSICDRNAPENLNDISESKLSCAEDIDIHSEIEFTDFQGEQSIFVEPLREELIDAVEIGRDNFFADDLVRDIPDEQNLECSPFESLSDTSTSNRFFPEATPQLELDDVVQHDSESIMSNETEISCSFSEAQDDVNALSRFSRHFYAKQSIDVEEIFEDEIIVTPETLLFRTAKLIESERFVCAHECSLRAKKLLGHSNLSDEINSLSNEDIIRSDLQEIIEDAPSRRKIHEWFSSPKSNDLTWEKMRTTLEKSFPFHFSEFLQLFPEPPFSQAFGNLQHARKIQLQARQYYRGVVGPLPGDYCAYKVAWMRVLKFAVSCVKKGTEIIKSLSRIVSHLTDEDLSSLFQYFAGLLEVYYIVCRIRISLSMFKNISPDELNLMINEVTNNWDKFQGCISSIYEDSLQKESILQDLVSIELNSVMKYDDSFTQRCLLCLLPCPPIGFKTDPRNQTVEYEDALYHLKCCNFWLNVVDNDKSPVQFIEEQLQRGSEFHHRMDS